MDHKDEFSKWIASIEEALISETTVVDEDLLEQGACGGCNNWDCPECFPDSAGELEGQQIPAMLIIGAGAGANDASSGAPTDPAQQGVGMAGAKPVNCPTCGHSHEDGDSHSDGDDIDVTMMPQPAEDEFEFDFNEEDDYTTMPPGRIRYEQMKDKIASVLIKLYDQGDSQETIGQMGDRVAKHLGYDPADTVFQDAWSTSLSDADLDDRSDYGMDDYTDHSMRQGEMGQYGLGEDGAEETPEVQPRSGSGKVLGQVIRKFVKTGSTDHAESPLTHGSDNLAEDDFDQNPAETIGKIMYMQSMGLSKADTQYTEEELGTMDPTTLKAYHDQVMTGTAPPASAPAQAAPAQQAPRQPRPTQAAQPAQPTMQEHVELSYTPSLYESIKWDSDINEAFIEESSLSKLIGKKAGGQKLVQWLHRKHKLGNMADLQPQPFNERMLWKEFKRNPDNFVVVEATNGVAGIKPYEKMIRDRMAAAAKKNKEYDPGNDATLQYQVIAFTADGTQIDPALLQPAAQPGEEREVDPTVMKARMGKISGKDTQNSDNVFNLLADQIGSLRTVYLAGGAVERDKMGQRDTLKKQGGELPEEESVAAIFKKIKPVLKTLVTQALSTLKSRIKQYNDDEDFASAQKIAANGQKLNQLVATIDTPAASEQFAQSIKQAIATQSGAPIGSPEYTAYLSDAAKGSSAALKPVLDALRSSLLG